MDFMFFGASALTSLNLSNWDTNPQPNNSSWIDGMVGMILCSNDPDSGSTLPTIGGTVNGESCN
jgi:surface protein